MLILSGKNQLFQWQTILYTKLFLIFYRFLIRLRFFIYTNVVYLKKNVAS